MIDYIDATVWVNRLFRELDEARAKVKMLRTEIPVAATPTRDNVFIVVDCQGFSIPSKYTHLARNWREIYRLFEEIIIGELILIMYDPDYNSDRHYKVSVMGRGHRGTYHRFSARYLTLDDAVRAALMGKL